MHARVAEEETYSYSIPLLLPPPAAATVNCSKSPSYFPEERRGATGLGGAPSALPNRPEKRWIVLRDRAT